MTIILEQGCRGPSESLLRAMFADRKSVFVDLLGWDLPVLDGRFELDQFDDPHATYIIIADAAGDHLGSARLLPTTRDHILDPLFRNLCAAPPPKGANVLEITRFCLSRRVNASVRRRTRNQLISALTSYALDQGVRTYTGVAELGWLQQILAFGWACRPLGVPIQSACGLLGALAIEIEPNTPALLAANHIWDMGEEVRIPQAA